MTRPILNPLTPIFDKRPRYGGIVVGGSPSVNNLRPSTVTSLVSAIAPTVTATSPELSVVGSVTDVLLDRVGRVIVDGDYAYLTSNPNDRLIVCDVSNPASPSVTGSRTSPNSLDQANGLAKSGNYVFVANGLDNNMSSNDVSTPSAPTLGSTVTSVTDLVNCTDIAVQGNYAFICSRPFSADDKLVAVDISNPLSMSIVGNVQEALFNAPQAVVVDGSYAYVISDTISDTLSVVDITTPASMTVVGQVTDATFLNQPQRLVKSGDIVYVAMGGVTSIDVSDPNNPAVLDHVGVSGAPTGICVIGDVVFTCSGLENKVVAVNAADPANLSILDTLVDSTNLSGVSDITTDGVFIYAAVFTGDRLTILEYA